MNLKLIIALIITSLLSVSSARADGENESYGNVDDYGVSGSYEGEPAPEYSGLPEYNGPEQWQGLIEACEKRENDPYRKSGQMSPLTIQITCVKQTSLTARVEAKGMDTYEVKSNTVKGSDWPVTLTCEEIRDANYDIDAICADESYELEEY